ncbi:MAG TPA: nucleotidyltransferase [Ktedonobacteraceae bacterium]|nr:nucleotidyltransferase [Ktedonobacteraceae bacterium]
MGKTVDEGFREFHGTLTPTRGESQAAKSQRIAVEACLRKSFEITRFFHTGSFGNGTSIQGYSDVDYFACIPAKHLRQHSFTMLQEVREALLGCFQSADIAIRPPAVRVRFATGAPESIEVVPADFIHRDQGGNFIYEIADGAGGWLRSSPDAHKNYVDEVDRKLDGKVKPLVRLLKAWKYYHGAPIRSFYLELHVTRYASQKKSIAYSSDVRNILKLLLENRLATLQDPKGISRHILPCASEAQRTDVLSKLAIAFTRAEKAREAEKAGNIRGAYEWWNLVFARKFPGYDALPLRCSDLLEVASKRVHEQGTGTVFAPNAAWSRQNWRRIPIGVSLVLRSWLIHLAEIQRLFSLHIYGTVVRASPLEGATQHGVYRMGCVR